MIKLKNIGSPDFTQVAHKNFLEAEHLSLQIEHLPILKNLGCSIAHGEVQAIVGEHGAGKTSLCQILAGYMRPTSGTIRVNGSVRSYLTPRTAQSYGIEYVAQHTPMVEHFSVAKNLFLDNRGIASHPFVCHSRQIKLATELLESLGIDLKPETLLRDLKLSDRVLVDIIKHLHVEPKLLILDEALQKLTTVNFRKIIRYLHILKDKGTSILFVTHRIDDIYEFADRVSIIRNGEILISDSVSKLEKINLIRLAYTQLADSPEPTVSTSDFVNLLKYNEAVLLKLPVVLMVFDRNMQLKLLNEEAKSFFHVPDTYMMNITIQEFLGPENQDLYNLIKPSFTSMIASRFFHLPLKHGDTEAIIDIDIHPIYDETFLMGYSVIAHDITEQETMRQQVIFSERLASIGLLAAGVAHEINNPLEIIINNLNLIRYHNTNDIVSYNINSIEEEIVDIAGIVKNLMSFTKDDEFSSDITDIVSTTELIIRFVRFEADNRGIQLLLQIEPQSLFCQIPRTEIKQVLLNLIKNGLEAMPNGGTLTATVVRVTMSNGMQEAEIRIHDEGSGIPEDKLSSIFLPFYSSKHSEGNHLGLGLSLSYGIITKRNGSIFARNTSPYGCEFTVRLPLMDLKHPADRNET